MPSSPSRFRRPARAPSRRTRLSPDEVRERLLSVSLGTFRARGYDATSVSDITREAGLAKGTFFNHFPTKDHVLAEAHARVLGDALEAVSDEGLRGTAAVLASFELMAGALESDRPLARLVFHRWSVLPAEATGALRARLREWLDDTLTFDLPVAELDTEGLPALLLATYAETVRTWSAHDAPAFPLVPTLRRRLVFLLRGAALPLA